MKMLNIGAASRLICQQCVKAARTQHSEVGLTSMHTSAPDHGSRKQVQIGYLRQRGIDVLRKPDINKVSHGTRPLTWFS